MDIVSDLVFPEIVEMPPKATVVHRGGKIGTWDDVEFCAAVKVTGKKQLIVGRITADVSHLPRKAPEYVVLRTGTVTGRTMFVAPLGLVTPFNLAKDNASGICDSPAPLTLPTHT